MNTSMALLTCTGHRPLNKTADCAHALTHTYRHVRHNEPKELCANGCEGAKALLQNALAHRGGFHNVQDHDVSDLQSEYLAEIPFPDGAANSTCGWVEQTLEQTLGAIHINQLFLKPCITTNLYDCHVSCRSNVVNHFPSFLYIMLSTVMEPAIIKDNLHGEVNNSASGRAAQDHFTSTRASKSI